MDNLIAYIFLALCVTVICFIVNHIMKSHAKKQLRPLSIALGGEMTISILKGFKLKLTQHDPPVTIELNLGGRYSPPCMTLRQECGYGFGLSVSSGDANLYFLERAGPVHDLKIDDARYQDLVIKTSDPEKTLSFMEDPTRREAILELFSLGMTEVSVEPLSVATSKLRYDETDLDPEHVKQVVEHLIKLTE